MTCLYGGKGLGCLSKVFLHMQVVSFWHKINNYQKVYLANFKGHSSLKFFFIITNFMRT